MKNNKFSSQTTLNNKQTQAQPSLIKTLINVIKFSGCNINKIYLSAFARTIERLLDILPLLLFYCWLILTITGESYLVANLFDLQNITLVTLALLIIFSLQFFISLWGQKLGFSASYNMMKAYRRKLYNHIYQLPITSIYQQPVGQLAELVTDDVDKVEAIFTHLLIEIIACICLPSVLILCLLWLDWQLTLALISGLPLAFFILHCGRKAFISVSQNKQYLMRQASGKMVEFSLGLTSLKLFNRSNVWLNKFIKLFTHINQASYKVEMYGAGPVVLYRLVIELGLAVLLIVSAYQLSNQLASFPITLLIFLLASKVIHPLLELSEHLTIFRYAAQSEQKLTHLTEKKPIDEPMQAKSPLSNKVEFNNVSLYYNDKNILNNISFTVSPGTVTAIVGRSGMGKSSILNLLARFCQPNSGEITVGDKTLTEIGSDNLYKHTSMVFQQVQLFADSIINNVRIGDPSASDAQVISACKKAYCHKFINELSNGYQTQIGENGIKLSGGQRQRLSIARAFLKNSAILLLDEATASIDPNSQYYIQQALAQLSKDKTLIIVAHRLTTVKHAKQILVVDEGEIISRGSHQELIKQQGLYHELWQEETNPKHTRH